MGLDVVEAVVGPDEEEEASRTHNSRIEVLDSCSKLLVRAGQIFQLSLCPAHHQVNVRVKRLKLNKCLCNLQEKYRIQQERIVAGERR